ncbi:MAG: ATP-binding protein [Chloroflexi bacterium]|nr:ATP-binding protein [Chloroflexota bacterium]
MSEDIAWKPIGTVVGNASTNEFTFILKSFKSRVGDLVAVRMEVPDEARQGTEAIYVWGRVISINRYNPFFPYEAAQELSNEGISLQDTILSNSRDQLEAGVLILGCTAGDGGFKNLYPLTYPVQPAAEVLYPPAETIKELLAGGIPGHTPLGIGTLIARRDVDIAIPTDRVVARHMAILAMTGGGKTVAARRILRELIELGYPLLILDPHGDYLGLWQKRDLFKGSTVRLLYPHIAMTEENRHIVEILINKMTEGLTEPQREELSASLSEVDPVEGESVLRYIKRLREALQRKIGQASDRRKLPTLHVCRRQLGVVESRLERMELTNERMRQRLHQLEFERMPDPQGRPEVVIAPRTVSILYLGGYDHLTQTTIASIVLEALYEHRANLSNRIPPFLAVIEEAHTFIPSSREGTVDVPSLETLRKLVTEGRKFGTGLVLISQRPSRVDETILSQCNSFLILRLVNPRDQNYVKQIMENLSEQDARMLPGFGPGQGIISGQAVRFPLLVRIKMDEDLVYTDLGDENFLQQAEAWKPDKHAPVRERVAGRFQQLSKLPDRRPKGGRSSRTKGGGSVVAEVKTSLSDSERWEGVAKLFAKDTRAMGDLEAATGMEWDRSRRRDKMADYARLSWEKLKAQGLSNRKREGLLRLLEAAVQSGQ